MDYVALTEIVLDRIQLEIWRRLDENDRKVFAALREPIEIDKFMKEKVKDLKSIIELSALVSVEQSKKSK